jgi:hypothetical protein
MDKTLVVINSMLQEGLFRKYAIGGGIGALFYIEPMATFDLDIFILPVEDPAGLISLSSLYDWTAKRGYAHAQEQIIIEGIPVQFIPAYNDLVTEAVLQSVEKKYKEVTTYVVRPEYLMAIMLQTSRPKDLNRLEAFLEEAELSTPLLNTILDKYGLKNSFDNLGKGRYDG